MHIKCKRQEKLIVGLDIIHVRGREELAGPPRSYAVGTHKVSLFTKGGLQLAPPGKD